MIFGVKRANFFDIKGRNLQFWRFRISTTGIIDSKKERLAIGDQLGIVKKYLIKFLAYLNIEYYTYPY